MNILLKIKSKIMCMINNKEYQFDDGQSAYEKLNGKYIVDSISAKEDIICIELMPITKNIVWEKEYVEQFGEEPSFF